jgi:hypothetical protein
VDNLPCQLVHLRVNGNVISAVCYQGGWQGRAGHQLSVLPSGFQVGQIFLFTERSCGFPPPNEAGGFRHKYSITVWINNGDIRIQQNGVYTEFFGVKTLVIGFPQEVK